MPDTPAIPSYPPAVPVAEVFTSAGRLRLELVHMDGRRYVQLGLYRQIPGRRERVFIRHAVRLPLSDARAFITLAKRIPAALRDANLPTPPREYHRPVATVNHLYFRVKELRAQGLDKNTASARALAELFNGRSHE